MFDDGDTFKQAFQQRCLLRATEPKLGLSFDVMPESDCNQLYWTIATLVFEQKTMLDMLAIILPKTTT